MAVTLAPVDTRVRLPAAVVAASARATQMQKEMLGEQPPAETPPADGAPPPAPAPAPPPPESDLEHKLRSTEGRLKVAERERQTLSARLAALEQNQNRPPPPVADPPIEVKKLLTPEEIEEYGESFLDVVRRQAKEEIAAEMFKVQRQINDLGKTVGSVAQTTVINARDKMKADLDEALPSWRTINYDEKFTSWLGLQDPLSGYIRHDMLKSAWAANRSQQVLNFFKAFVAEEAAGSPPAPGNGAQPAPNGSTPPAKVKLEDLAAPGRAGSAAAPVPADKPIITRAQVTQFYADVAAGKYRGREAEKLENDAAIILAGNEGRIV